MNGSDPALGISTMTDHDLISKIEPQAKAKHVSTTKHYMLLNAESEYVEIPLRNQKYFC
jgi:hypothetical protein